MKDTLIISAFPGCGKSFAYEALKEKIVILDSDSSDYSWTEKSSGVRHPDFPANYIKHIKDNIGASDIIMVSSHAEVRTALKEAGLSYLLVFPEPSEATKALWLSRFKLRGSTEVFINLISTNWDNWIKELYDEEHIGGIFVLGANSRFPHIMAMLEQYYPKHIS
jgi:hypothetical protein